MSEVGQRIHEQIQANRALGMKGDNWDNWAVGLLTTQHEIEDDDGQIGYVLTDATRDKILRNGRQDGAHALANTTSILNRVHQLTRLVYVLLVLVIAIGGALVYVLIRQVH
ncbi:hypothetical protein ASF28_10090 [Methylobacterium sp. Leaf99]|uniref:hypothetical protein n=1 Tax=Methylobacterium sp. Leaf99 TaxID=1736251 RepID=UPI00070213A5|nr:hypothetical protein [Methylobacterium sp. Leaf99]KQP07496.1 hypothetical protein ASF28_10090 [Methylobacterium sp. Leaf99]